MNENIKGQLDELLLFDIVPGVIIYYSLFSLHFKTFFILFFLLILLNCLILLLLYQRNYKKEKTEEVIRNLNFLIHKQN
jgi:hypothetical protein